MTRTKPPAQPRQARPAAGRSARPAVPEPPRPPQAASRPSPPRARRNTAKIAQHAARQKRVAQNRQMVFGHGPAKRDARFPAPVPSPATAAPIAISARPEVARPARSTPTGLWPAASSSSVGPASQMTPVQRSERGNHAPGSAHSWGCIPAQARQQQIAQRVHCPSWAWPDQATRPLPSPNPSNSASKSGGPMTCKGTSNSIHAGHKSAPVH